jgi:acyl dehydratase
LKNRASAQFKAQASLGWNWSFRAPVIAEDKITVGLAIAEMRATRDGRRGILTLEFVVTNQRAETVQQGSNRLMVYA